MTRRSTTWCLLLLACGGCSREVATDRDEPSPAAPEIRVPKPESVVLVTIDTLRADYLGMHGGRARTPVLDALATNGWSFDNCFSTSMLTNPAHASIMTSLYSRDHGVYDNESGITTGVRTLAMAMERRGLRTAAVVNFPHLNPEVANLGGGFQRFVRASRHERRASELTHTALGVIDQLGANEPFFLWLHYTDPHAPYDPPADHRPRSPPGKVRTPMNVAARAAPRFQRNNPWFSSAFTEIDSVEAMIEQYIAEIETADAGVGDLVEGLLERGRAHNTAIIVTSDHGENMGEHQLYFHHGGLYREAVHVPLIISVPGATPVRIAGLVEIVDIAPTVLELMGAPRWEPMRGRSLVGVVRGRERAREHVFSEHMLAQLVSVRSEQGTLILHRKSSRQFPSYRFTTGCQEVYDTRLDPDENHNLGEASPLSQRLEEALESYLEAGLHLAARPAIEQDRESLRELGYIE